MKIVAKSGLIYVPEFNSNKKLPEAERVQIEYKYLTGPERDRIIGLAPIKFDAEGNPKSEYEFRFDTENMIRTSVVKIKNLVIEKDGKDKPAEVEDLVNVSELAGLYRELSDFFLTENRAQDKKK